MSAFYNEIDPYAAQWLRNLIEAGHIAPGIVDERSIVDVRPDEVVEFTQCHFFAGLGGWSHALRLAGWPDDRPVWTGSVPCQPLSVAGQQKGHVDERHLWPAFHRLIAVCKPATIFGEQVAGKDGREWLAAVRTDLEGDGYACGAADLSAAGVGAPHIRQRLYWMAHADLQRCGEAGRAIAGKRSGVGRSSDLMAHADDARPQGRLPMRQRPDQRPPWQDGVADGMADADGERVWDRRRGAPEGAPRGVQGEDQQRQRLRPDARPDGEDGGFWSDAVWLPCRDGKYRPAQPSLQPLAHGVSARVGRLRAYGNAIVAPLAASFVAACMDTLAINTESAPFKQAAE